MYDVILGVAGCPGSPQEGPAQLRVAFCVTRSEAAWEVPVGPPGQPWSRWSCFGGGLPFLALVQAITVAVHLEDMNVVG